LLLLDKTLAYHLVNRGLDEARGNWFAVSVSVAVVDDNISIFIDVLPTFLQSGAERVLRFGRRKVTHVPCQGIQSLQGTKNATMPQVSLSAIDIAHDVLQRRTLLIWLQSLRYVE
jgi:hypothetical protein